MSAGDVRIWLMRHPAVHSALPTNIGLRFRMCAGDVRIWLMRHPAVHTSVGTKAGRMRYAGISRWGW